MKFSFLSYNLLYNRARGNLEQILKTYRPDIICFQEIATEEANLKTIETLGYRLADYSNSFIKGANILGVATFYKGDKFTFAESRSFDLERSIYEFMRFIVSRSFKRRTVLKTTFISKKTKKTFTVYNLHLNPFAANRARDKHIRNTFEDMHLVKRMPVIIAGDFNYPYGRRKFEQLIKRYNLREATNNLFYTFETKVLKIFSARLKLDYILYKDIELISTSKIEVRHSDHFPILSIFEI